jgi:hypothetical protein
LNEFEGKEQEPELSANPQPRRNSERLTKEVRQVNQEKGRSRQTFTDDELKTRLIRLNDIGLDHGTIFRALQAHVDEHRLRRAMHQTLGAPWVTAP